MNRASRCFNCEISASNTITFKLKTTLVFFSCKTFQKRVHQRNGNEERLRGWRVFVSYLSESYVCTTLFKHFYIKKNNKENKTTLYFLQSKTITFLFCDFKVFQSLIQNQIFKIFSLNIFSLNFWHEIKCLLDTTQLQAFLN